MFWCVLCGMQFAILYGMLDVYTNPVLSSTRLNWYKTFDFKSQWVIYFATPPPNPPSLLRCSFRPSRWPHCCYPTVCCTARSARATSSVQRDSVCAMCRCALFAGVSAGYNQPTAGPLFTSDIRLLLAGGAKTQGRDSDCPEIIYHTCHPHWRHR